MTYYAKERRLQIGVYEKVYLTIEEDYILKELIKNGQVEIEKNNRVKTCVARLRRKTGLKIRSIANYGYRLESEVYLGEDTNEQG